jgi:ribosome-associated protein
MKVTRSITIPDDELRFTFTTSSGPGGQHANKASTRVEVTWNVDESKLPDRTKERIRGRLRHRIDSSGTLRVGSERHRSQTRNREDALERLAALVANALKPEKKRTPTAPSRAARERRLSDKKHRAGIKRARRPTSDE